MPSMAKIQIIGNVGRDPEQRYSQAGNMVVSFSVAVNNRKRNPDGSYEDETEWFRVSAFGRLAETCQQFVTKGRTVFIDGRLRLDRWTGQDGQPRTTLEINASEMVLMDPRPRGEGFEQGSGGFDRPAGESGDQRPAEPRRAAAPAPSDADQNDLEDLPF